MEILDIVDENGNPTGETVERTQAHARGIRHRTAHVWLVRMRNGCPEILLQKRCSSKESFPGCYDISSAGHIPAGSDFVPSAIRELQEELGVGAEPEELIFCGDRQAVWIGSFGGKPFLDSEVARVFLLRRDLPESAFHLQAEEVSAVRWMGLAEVIAAVKENTIPHCIYLDELQMVQKKLDGYSTSESGK